MKARADNYKGLWLLIALLAAQTGKNPASACFGAHKTHTKMYTLNHLNGGEERAVTRGLRLKEGKFLYGQLTVSPSQASSSILVTTSWHRYAWEVPVWVYLRQQNLPTSTYFDKTAIGYLLEQKSVVKMDEVDAGVYYVKVEARADVANLTITVDIVPRQNSLYDRLLSQYNSKLPISLT